MLKLRWTEQRADTGSTGVEFGHRTSSWVLRVALVTLLLAAVSAPSMAFAQEGGDSGSASQNQSEEGDSIEVPPDAENYWAKVREIYTVQKRPFEKVNRFSVTAYGGVIPNNIFERYYPVGLRLNYFILENIGIEVAGSYAFDAKTPVNGVMGEASGINADTVRVGDSQLAHTNVGIVWSPFYGKSAFYDEDIGYFDLFLVGGVGLAVTQTVPSLGADPETTPKAEGVLGAGLAWYFPNHGALRLDYRQFAFQKIGGGVSNPSEISLGVSYFF